MIRKSTHARRRALRHDLAKPLRANATGAERLLWALLRDRKLPVRFRRQQPVGPLYCGLLLRHYFFLPMFSSRPINRD